MKEAGLSYKYWRGVPLSSSCKQCPAAYTNPVCGSDGHSYLSKVRQQLNYIIMPNANYFRTLSVIVHSLQVLHIWFLIYI